MKKISLLIVAMLISVLAFAISPITGSSAGCVGLTDTLRDGTPGGIWSSSDTSIAIIDASTGIVNAISSGSVNITYTVGSSYEIYVFSVYPSSIPPLTGTPIVCVGFSTVLSDSLSGGGWSTSDYRVASVGWLGGTTYGISTGTATITYTGPLGCSYTTLTVTVSALSTGTISGDTIVCTGATIALADGVAGGSWSSSDPAIASVSGTGVVTGIDTGMTVITYSIIGSCGTAYTTYNVYVNNGAISAISGYMSSNIGGYSFMYNATPGGTWSSSNPLVASIDPVTGIVTGISGGTATISYSMVGCTGPVYTTATFTVYTSISGTVFLTGMPYTGYLKVWLIRYNPLTFDLEASDSTMIWSNGDSAVDYIFYAQSSDSFRIKAYLDYDSAAYVPYLPTYHNSNFYWHDATVLWHSGIADDTAQNIVMASGIYTSGTGFIGGSVFTGANRGTSGGIAVKGINLVLMNAATSTIVRKALTDASGNYSFNNLPIGQTYYVFPDSLNFTTMPFTGISLTTTHASITNASFIQHTLSHTITPISTSVNQLQSSISSIVTMPNPTTGSISIYWNENIEETGEIAVIDATGQIVYTQSINMNAGSGQKKVNLSNLSDGIYLLSIRSGAINYNEKIALRH